MGRVHPSALKLTDTDRRQLLHLLELRADQRPPEPAGLTSRTLAALERVVKAVRRG